MTIRQILNRISQLADLAAQCLAEGAKQAAAEFYNLIYLYEIQLEYGK
jgi:hypothetical protein